MEFDGPLVGNDVLSGNRNAIHRRCRSMLGLKQVSKSYAGQSILAGIDWHLASGSTHVLIGPSGCGKSTLLRILRGLVAPDAGQVIFAGQPRSALQLLRDSPCGYVIQEGGLFPHLTARDNVCLPARFRRWRSAAMRDRLDRLVQLTEFPTDGLQRFPSQLSGGQRQRLSLMRALMLDPEVLLLDEPLGALDPMIRSQLQTELKRIFNQLDKTVVLVTHDLHEAAFFADQITLMRDGTIVQTGSLQQLLQSPADAFVTEFVSAQRQLGWIENSMAGDAP